MAGEGFAPLGREAGEDLGGVIGGAHSCARMG